MTAPMPQGSPLDQAGALDAVWHWVTAYALLLPRPLALLSINPVFTRTDLSNLLKGMIATGLLLPFWPMTATAVAQAPASAFTFVLLSIKEALVGTALGLPLSLPFWVLLSAGDIIDQQRGATQGRLNDPAGFGDLSIVGTLFLLCGIAILAETGHLDQTADALYRSWRVWRPLEFLPIPDVRAADLVLHLLDEVQRQSLTLAAPVLLVMLIGDVAMMLLARMAPQLRADDLSLAVRNLVFMIFMPLYAGFFVLYAAGIENQLARGLRILGAVLPPSATGAAP